MIGKIVITSVPQGLGGGSGFQPVLRTAGLRPSIAERLAMRASYPHPYEFGNPANPHVLFHRIETVGDRTIHILGSVRDAGSSYTGRSNYLAELIAIDSSEKRSLPAGPAFVARAFPWLHQWLGEPHEIPLGQEPAIPAEDPEEAEGTGSPRVCTKWASLSGDAGWAGELARSFVEGRSAVIWVEKSDDVPALFVEAARLLPPSERWRVTFNTCEIEPFPAHWRALRADLPVVGPRPSAKDLVLDLAMLCKTGQRAPENSLVLLARGTPPKKPTTTTQLPTDAGNRHAYPDDAALRAHLKEISDERKRRSKSSPGTHDTASRRSIWHVLTATAIGGVILAAVLITIIALQVGLDPNSAPRWFGGLSGQQPSDDLGLRRRDEPADVRGQHQDKETSTASKTPSEAQEKSHAPSPSQTQAEPSEHADRPQDVKPDLPRPPMRDIAAKKAIEDLTKDDGKAVQLRREPTSETSADTLIEQESSLPVTDLCSFSASLCKPEIELAGPYDKDERLSVARVSGESRWRIDGALRDELLDANTSLPRELVGELIAQNGRLKLQPHLKDGHLLVGRLENSVLLVYSCDPANPTAARRLRCKVFFSKPLESAQTRITLDPLTKREAETMPEKVAARIKDVRNAEWEVVLRCSTGDEHLIRSPKTQASFKLFPASKPIFYQGLEGDGGKTAGSRTNHLVPIKNHNVDFQVQTTVVFSPSSARFVLESEVTNLEKLPWHKQALTLEALQNARLNKTRDALDKALTNTLLGRRHEDEAYQLALFDDFLKKEWEKTDKKKKDDTPKWPKDLHDFIRYTNERDTSFRQIPVPNQNYPQPGGGMKTYTDTPEYQKNVKQWNKDFGILAELQGLFWGVDGQEGHADRDCRTHADLVVDAIWKNIGCVGPITAHILKFQAVVKDSEGNDIKCPIVTEHADHDPL